MKLEKVASLQYIPSNKAMVTQALEIGKNEELNGCL